MSTLIVSPLEGTVNSLSTVPDPVFSNGIVGPGIALTPVIGQPCEVKAPIAGTLVKLHPHAFVISGSECSILVHLGIDTVKMEGEGFTLLVAEGDQVEVGQPMITWNPEKAIEAGYDPICPVIALEWDPEGIEVLSPLNQVVATGQDLVRVFEPEPKSKGTVKEPADEVEVLEVEV